MKPMPSPSPSRPRVIVADDNADAALAFALILDFEGYEAHVAHDGVAALELASRLRPAAAFLDIGMPGLDGLAVAAQLRREPWGRTMLLVATTGRDADEDRRRGTQAGFDAHLVKPVDIDAAIRLLADNGAGPG